MFTSKTFDFLAQLSHNNQREWFAAHQSDYENWVRTPALNFIEAMQKPLAKLAPHFSAIPKKAGGSLMRVHRDVRFARDKSPYKTNIGIQFRHELGKDVHAPGFYVHIADDDCFLGAGCWHPEADALFKIRNHLSEHPKAWLAARDHPPFRQHFTLSGDSTSRLPRGFVKDHPLADDLRRKDFIALMKINREEVLQDNFVAFTADAFKHTVPLVRFLCQAVGVAF